MDLSAALQFLASLATKAAAPQKLDQVDPRATHLVVGGKIERIDHQPPLRHHQVGTLADLIAYAQHCAESDDADPQTVWHSDESVVLFPDDTDRLDRVTFRLTHAPAFAALRALDQVDRPMDQRTFIRLLRFTLGASAAEAARWRKLDWELSQKATVDAQHGRDRMGREIRAEVTGTAELPEELSFQVPVYEQAGEQEPRWIRAAVELDAQAQRITLRPIPGEIHAAIDAAQRSIRERLDEAFAGLDCVRVYHGVP